MRNIRTHHYALDYCCYLQQLSLQGGWNASVHVALISVEKFEN